MGKGRNDGGVVDYSEPGSIEGRLTNFDIGSAGLLLIHRIWLDNNIVPVLEAGGSVSITGLTSRSGSAQFNLDLSKRRANGVLTHLRKNVRGQVSYSMNSGYEVKSVNGVGETMAEQAGQKDGSEDAFHRAAIVFAWHKPTPPPAPKPKVVAPNIKRVISRKWHKFNSRMSGEPGELGMEFGELVGDIITGHTKGGSDDRAYAMVPADHVVTHVRDEFIIDNEMGFGVSTTTYTQTIEYRWGPPVDQVFLLKRTKRIETGIEHDWRTVDRTHYPRSEIWKHTTAPDQAVNW